MSRWIDADEVAKLMKCGCAYAIWELPSIDIVRCGECKWVDKCSQNVAMQDTYQMYEKIDYCSYGERGDAE